MEYTLSRRKVLLSTAGIAVGVLMGSEVMGQGTPAAQTPPTKPPPLPAELVKEFVIAAHANFDKLKTMLDAEPRLLNATWDWSHGDFESAIGGAGHMGRADIARYLIDHGARYDLFVAAMLGELGTVKAILSTTPTLAHSAGPHGIPLIAHAKAGGDVSKPVVDYLESLGA